MNARLMRKALMLRHERSVHVFVLGQLMNFRRLIEVIKKKFPIKSADTIESRNFVLQLSCLGMRRIFDKLMKNFCFLEKNFPVWAFLKVNFRLLHENL